MMHTGGPTTLSGDEVAARLDGPVHGWFELTYAAYLTRSRTLLQSMPVEWQERMVACLEELDAAFAHIETPEVYQVTAAVESTYGSLTEAEMKLLGVSRSEPEGDGDESRQDYYYDRDGNEWGRHDPVLVPRPGGDPIPHYNRGRTFIEPQPA